MYYGGIDLHKKTSFLTTVDQKGKVVAPRQSSECGKRHFGLFCDPRRGDQDRD